MQGTDRQDFRLRLGADPSDPALAREAMALGDGAQDELRRAQAFERALGEALAIPVPDQLAQRLQAIAVQKSSGGSAWSGRAPWLALAASLLLVLGLASTIWVNQPATASPLGIAAVEHLVHEPFALLRTEIVAQERLDGLLRKAGLELPQAVAVNYASPCPVYGQQTVHMVVQQPSGPVSVIYFPRRESDALGDFRHGPTNGRALAYGDGMLVLMANDDAGIGAVEAIWQSAMLAGEPSGQLIAGMD
ncbi:MAG: DUF3379 family protein [Xanthomonadales bacterium]|nr:DUF3379 family protein [Xanthomonadales bacterium]